METDHSTIDNQLLSKNSYVELYINSLTVKEKKAYIIAENHLGSSFDVQKSVGYLNFVKTTAK